MTYDELNAAGRDDIVAVVRATITRRINYETAATHAERLLRELSARGWTVKPPERPHKACDLP